MIRKNWEALVDVLAALPFCRNLSENQHVVTRPVSTITWSVLDDTWVDHTTSMESFHHFFLTFTLHTILMIIITFSTNNSINYASPTDTRHCATCFTELMWETREQRHNSYLCGLGVIDLFTSEHKCTNHIIQGSRDRVSYGEWAGSQEKEE
jgi:hypothetical protein